MNSETAKVSEHAFKYGSKEIKFSLLKSDRKQLRIEVTPEMDIVVKAPEHRSLKDIIDRVKQKSPRIIKQRIFFEQFYPKITTRKYISGETFFFLGKEYILRVRKASHNNVSIKDKTLLVEFSNNSEVSTILQKRYLEQAKNKFMEYNQNIQKKFTHYGVSPKKLIVRRMKSRWGSCSKAGNITLNTDLIQAPRGCIEYVLNHEYCHLIEFGHTRKFYELQKETMSDWSKWKNKLEKLLA